MNSTAQPNELYIGLMSGTSADGVDAALVSFKNNLPTLHHFISTPYSATLKAQLVELNQTPHIELEALCALENQLAMAFVETTKTLLKASNHSAADICALASHGQTIYHAPQHQMSFQIGHPAFLAKQLGIPTVGDVRIDDMANQGQGAPLAPAFHETIWGKHSEIALVNIGGIANISYLGLDKTIGFDTGPGNGLMDEYCKAYLNKEYDQNGDIAANAEINTHLLTALMQAPYFQQPPPKTTGRDLFNLNWLNNLIEKHTRHISHESVISTLNQLTVETILLGLSALSSHPKKLLLCGGGARNHTLMNRLKSSTSYPISSTDAEGISSDAMEAMMFAWLAKQRIHNQPISLKDVTGATKDSVLGGLWHP